MLATITASCSSGAAPVETTATTRPPRLDAWTRVGLDPATFEPGSEVDDIVVRGSELVAVGADPAGVATIWRSTDETTWTRATLDGPDAATASPLRHVAATQARLLATGFPLGTAQDALQAAAWMSEDGAHWREVALPDGAPSIYALAAKSEAFIATGAAAELGPWLWTGDGTGTWVERSATEAGFARSITDLLVFADLIVAVGHQGEFGGSLVLTSTDGVTWKESTVADSAGDPAPETEAATMFQGDFIGVGRADFGDAPRLGVWTSPDAQTWQRISTNVMLPKYVIVQNAVATPVVVAALARPYIFGAAAVVMSTDGVAWTSIALESPTFGNELKLTTLIARGDELLLFGLYAIEWGERVLMRGGAGRVGQVTPPAWRSTRSR